MNDRSGEIWRRWSEKDLEMRRQFRQAGGRRSGEVRRNASSVERKSAKDEIAAYLAREPTRRTYL